MIYKKFTKYQRLYKKYWFSYQNKKINLKISWDSTFKLLKIEIVLCSSCDGCPFEIQKVKRAASSLPARIILA
jgi:hypothetical protein